MVPITLSSPLLRGPTPVDPTPTRAGGLRAAGSREDTRQRRLDGGGAVLIYW